jgi:PAP2 superfamily
MSATADPNRRRASWVSGLSTLRNRGFTKGISPSVISLHVVVTIAMTVAVVPLLRINHLPMKFAWAELFEIYCVAFALQGTVAGILLYTIGFSPRETLGPILERLWADKRRVLILLPFLFVLYLLCAGLAAVSVWPVIALLSIAVLEVFDRTQGKHILSSRLITIALSAAYLFWGLVLVSAYNDIVVVSQRNVTYDATFNRIDSWLMHGMTVSAIAHHATLALPHWFYAVVEFVYYSCMFPQVGGALMLLSFRCSRRETLRFVVALLSAYYFAVALFWLWPSQGPFFMCQTHFSEFPSNLRTFSIQRILSEKTASLWAGHGIRVIGLDYYIAFPSMHIAIVTIVAVFLRRWKRVFYTLLACDALILATVILLEWHYILDLVGGLAVAALVTVLVPPRVESTCASAFQSGLAVTNSSGALG